MQVGMNLAYNLPLDKDSEYAKKVDAVDAEVLAKFAATHLELEKRQQLIVRPA
jgi:predicted Zn-dependent peptidase